MSLQQIKDAYQKVLASVPLKDERIRRPDLYVFIGALGEFGRSLAPSRLYADLAHDAEEFSSWVYEEIRDPFKTSWFMVRARFAVDDEIINARILSPLLDSYEVFDLATPPLLGGHLKSLNESLHRRNPVGEYFLHLASMARDVEEEHASIMEELADCLESSWPLLLDLTLRAAKDFYWEARKRFEDVETEPPSNTLAEGEDAAGNQQELGEGTPENESVEESDNPCWHEAHVEPDREQFKGGSLRGTKKELSMCFKTDSMPSQRRVDDKAKKGHIFLRKHNGQDWEIIAKTPALYEEYKARLQAWKDSQNSTNMPEQA